MIHILPDEIANQIAAGEVPAAQCHARTALPAAFPERYPWRDEAVASARASDGWFME